MSQKFQASVQHRGDVSYVKLGGVIDEDNELADLVDKIPTGTAVILPANTAKAFIEDYSWDESKDLIIAFDIAITQGQGNVRHGPAISTPPPKSYLKARQSATVATAQTANQDRTSDFQPSQSHYLVEQIEVA